MLEVRVQDIFMSFCIPVYNGAKTIRNTVQSILTSHKDNIEVVLFYDKSNDDTLKIITSISDKRVRIVYNENRLPYGKMLLECGKSAKGKYLMYVMNRNYLSGYKIDELIDYLEKNSRVICGMCAPIKSGSFMTYDDISAKILKFAYQEEHPSGDFFHRNLFIKATEEIANVNHGNFPLDYIYAQICMEEGQAILYNYIYYGESDYVCRMCHTQSTKAIKKEWYSPYGKRKCFNTAVNHLINLPIQIKDKKRILKELFLRMLDEATYGYKSVMVDVRFCNHYLIRPTYIGCYTVWYNYIKFFLLYTLKKIKLYLRGGSNG